MLSVGLLHIEVHAGRDDERRPWNPEENRRIFMTHIELSPVTRPVKIGLVGRLAAVVLKWWNQVQKERRLSATINTLHRLNDHSLRDIGLERDEIGQMVRARSRGR